MSAQLTHSENKSNLSTAADHHQPQKTENQTEVEETSLPEFFIQEKLSSSSSGTSSPPGSNGNGDHSSPHAKFFRYLKIH